MDGRTCMVNRSSSFLEKAWFQYKYCVLNNGEPERWEVGLNRIADIELMKAN